MRDSVGKDHGLSKLKSANLRQMHAGMSQNVKDPCQQGVIAPSPPVCS